MKSQKPILQFWEAVWSEKGPGLQSESRHLWNCVISRFSLDWAFELARKQKELSPGWSFEKGRQCFPACLCNTKCCKKRDVICEDLQNSITESGKNTRGTAVHPVTGDLNPDNLWQIEKMQKIGDTFSSFLKSLQGLMPQHRVQHSEVIHPAQMDF